MSKPTKEGFYMFRREGQEQWRPTEVLIADGGGLCAYKTWADMQFPHDGKSVYNTWTCVYTDLGEFGGDWKEIATCEQP